MTEIFSKYAPAYWAKGIPVIPLRIMEKRPVHDNWSQYCKEMPSQFVRDQWLQFHTNNNMGCPLGPQSGLVFIDIDSLDPKIEAAIMSVLPKSPWKRIGAKGCIYAYRFSGEEPKKIKDKNGAMLVEILSTGNQAVLPPSIHPDTKEPYQANCELVDVYDILPKLPADVYDRLRAALSGVTELSSGAGSRHKMTEFVSFGARDVSMTRHAGFLSFAVRRGEISLRAALDNMAEWCQSMVMKVQGDPLDVNKGLAKVIEFIKTDVARGHILPPGWDMDLTPEQKIEWGLNFSETEEEWPVNQINDYIFAKFSETTSPTDPKRQEVVKFVLNKLAKSAHLDKMDEGQILTNLKKSSGLELPLSFYTKQLNELRKGPIEGISHNQIAEAVMELWEERKGKLAYMNSEFWLWNGCHWEVVSRQKLWNTIAEEYGELAAAKRASDHKGIIEVLGNLLPQQLSPIPTEGVNFQNGFLTKDLRLIEHQPEQGCTYVLPYSYRPEVAGKCPKFFEYLIKSWGNDDDFKDKVEALREAMAVTLFGMSTSFQRCFLLVGPGSTGKSVLLDVIEALVPPEVCCAVAPEQWGEKFTTSMFAGKLLNRAGELSDNKKISGEIFKQIVDGSPLKVEMKMKPGFTFSSKCAHWFASNHLPKTTDTSSGFSRRWLIFNFDKVVKEEEKIIDYGQIIVSDEMEAIVAWVVEVVPHLITKGSFTLSKSHLELVNSMSLANSSVRTWMNERVVKKEGVMTKHTELYQDFWSYCAGVLSTKVLSPPMFKREIHQILLEEGTLNTLEGSDGEVYVGLTLKRKAK